MQFLPEIPWFPWFPLFPSFPIISINYRPFSSFPKATGVVLQPLCTRPTFQPISTIVRVMNLTARVV